MNEKEADDDSNQLTDVEDHLNQKEVNKLLRLIWKRCQKPKQLKFESDCSSSPFYQTNCLHPVY